jgi:hypothetical protein
LHDSHSGSLRCSSRLRADGNGRDREPELCVPPRGRRRGEHNEVTFRRLGRPNRPCSVEGDEVGAELVDEQPPGVLGAREENAPGWTRKLRQQALLCRDSRDEIDLAAPSLGGRLPDRGHPPRFAFGPAAKLARPGDACQEQPVIG